MTNNKAAALGSSRMNELCQIVVVTLTKVIGLVMLREMIVPIAFTDHLGPFTRTYEEKLLEEV